MEDYADTLWRLSIGNVVTGVVTWLTAGFLNR